MMWYWPLWWGPIVKKAMEWYYPKLYYDWRHHWKFLLILSELPLMANIDSWHQRVYQHSTVGWTFTIPALLQLGIIVLQLLHHRLYWEISAEEQNYTLALLLLASPSSTRGWATCYPVSMKNLQQCRTYHVSTWSFK